LPQSGKTQATKISYQSVRLTLGKYLDKFPSTGVEKFTNYKQRGEWVELLFMTRAAKRGFSVSKPWGDSARYDITLEQDGRFKRVQVKCTDRWNGSAYTCGLVSGKQKRYTIKQIDYFAIYLVLDDIWYIFPAKRLIGQTAVVLTPHRQGHEHGRYKEAWDLLDPRKHISIKAAEAAEAATNAIPRKHRRPNRPCESLLQKS
jgi:hypothetical protein